MSIIPEIIASLAFFPSGAAMGYMIFIFFFREIDSSIFWSYIIGLISACVTALVLISPKVRSKGTMQWNQMYLLLLASGMIVVTGFFLEDNDVVTTAFFGIAAHGITLVAGPSYLTFRPTPYRRNYTMSLAIVLYFCGISAIAHIMTVQYFNSIPYVFYGSGGIMAVLIILLELFNCVGVVNYKQSLDTHILNAGYKGVLLASKYQIVRYYNANCNVDGSEKMQWIQSIALTFTRISGFFIFAYPMLIISVEVTTVYFNNTYHIHLLMWLATAGALTSTIFTIFINTKNVFSIASLMYLACLVTMIITVINLYIEAAAIAFLISLFSLGLCYHISFSAIMETANFKFTEILLTICYAVEMLTIGMIHYLFMHNSNSILSTYADLTVLYYGLTFCVSLVILMIIVQKCLPKTFGRSLILIRNELLNIQFCDIPTTSIQVNSMHRNVSTMRGSEIFAPRLKHNPQVKAFPQLKAQSSTQILFERNGQQILSIPRPFFDRQPDPMLQNTAQ